MLTKLERLQQNVVDTKAAYDVADAAADAAWAAADAAWGAAHDVAKAAYAAADAWKQAKLELNNYLKEQDDV